MAGGLYWAAPMSGCAESLLAAVLLLAPTAKPGWDARRTTAGVAETGAAEVEAVGMGEYCWIGRTCGYVGAADGEAVASATGSKGVDNRVAGREETKVACVE